MLSCFTMFKSLIIRLQRIALTNNQNESRCGIHVAFPYPVSLSRLFFQSSWEKRILKSLNSMCTELSVPLARKVSLPTF